MLSEFILLIVFTRLSTARISNIEFSTDEKSQYIRNNENFYEETSKTEVDPALLYPDYPNLTEIPETEFSCKGKVNWRYYADPDANCQVFHICQSDYAKISFLCPMGSVFNQRYLVCDWWYNFDCNDAINLYEFSSEINEQLDIVQVEGEQI